MLVCTSLDINASNNCKEDWKKKMMSEKIAFLTIELDITPEEAQVFWPVYNQVETEKDQAMKKRLRSICSSGTCTGKREKRQGSRKAA